MADLDVSSLDPVLQGTTTEGGTAKGDLDVSQLDPVLGGGSPTNPGGSTEPTKGWAKGFKNFLGHLTRGGDYYSKGVLGLGLAYSDQPLEEVDQAVQSHAMLQAQKDAEDYGNTDGYQLAVSKGLGWAAEQIPNMGLGGAAMVTGGVVATIAGAPVVAGAAVGGALLFGTLAVGNHMYDTMKYHNVDRINARVGAVAAGMVNFGTALASGLVGGKGVTDASAAALNSLPWKTALLDAGKRFVTNTGLQIGASEVNALADATIKYITSRTSKGATLYTLKEAQDDMLRATIQTFTTAPIIAGATETVGTVGGKLFKDHVDRTKAITDWLNRESAAIEAKHIQSLYANSHAIMQAPISPAMKSSAIKQLTTQAERSSIVEKAVLAVRVKKAANPNKGNPLLSQNPLEERERLQGQVAKVADGIAPWSRTFGQPFVTLEGQLVMAFQDTPTPEPLAEELGTSKAVAEAGRLRLEYSNNYYDHMTKATGLSNAKVQDLEHKAFSDHLEVFHTDAHGLQAVMDLTAGEAIKYVMLAENTDAQAALFEPFRLGSDGIKIGNGFSQDTIYQLKAALYESDPNYLKAINGLRAFYDDMGPILKRDYEALNPGETLDLQANYGGKITRDGATEITVDPDKMIPLMPGGDLKNPGFTKSRGPSKVFINPDDAFAAAGKRVRQQAQWKAMAPAAPLWAQLMADPAFKQAVNVKFPGLYASIKEGYVATISGGSAHKGSPWLNNVMKARSFSKLAGKAVQLWKHVNTLPNFLLYEFRGKALPTDEFTKGVLDFHAHPIAVAKMILDWDEVKVRYANPEKILAQLNADSMSPGETRAQRLWMKPFELGDQYALIAGTNAVYKYVLKETNDPVLAKAEAVKAFRNVLASGEMDQQSSIARNPVGKVAVQFRQPEMRLAQTVVQRYRTAANFPTPENINRAVRTHMLSSIAAGLFVLPETVVATGAAALSGHAEEAQEKWFRFLQRSINGNMFPLMDDAIINTQTQLTNMVAGTHFSVFEFSAAPGDGLKSSASLVDDAIHWIEGKGDPVHLAWKTVLDTIGTANLAGKGFPEAPVRGADWLSDIFGLEPERKHKQ